MLVLFSFIFFHSKLSFNSLDLAVKIVCMCFFIPPYDLVRIHEFKGKHSIDTNSAIATFDQKSLFNSKCAQFRQQFVSIQCFLHFVFIYGFTWFKFISTDACK